MCAADWNYMKMNAVELTFVFFIFTPKVISFGCCDNFPFSLCWTSRGDIMRRQNNDILLNDQSLRLVGEGSSIASVTVSRGMEHKLTLRHENLVHTWTVSIDSNATLTKVKGDVETQMEPQYGTKFFQTLILTEVFPCENNTIIFYSDGDFTVAIGSSMRLDVSLESRTPSSLLLSWVQSSANSTTTLYHSTSDVYRSFSVNNTADNKYNFTGLDTCTPYVACVERDTALLICLFTFTDPEVPQDFIMTSWNSSSVSLAWSYPSNHAHFLLTAFYLNGTDHIINKKSIWHKESDLELTVSNLPVCSRVKFGLQTVCQEGMDSHYSSMVPHHGNSLHSSIEGLCQTAYGPDNYTLSWDIGNASSISKFKIYNDEEFYGITSTTNFTVGGLDPCQQYHAKVVAICGDDVVVNVKTATTHTGLEGVSGLSYHANESTASWASSLPFHSGVAFLYELSEDNGTTILSSSLNDTALHLPTLEQSKSYVLDVWEQCDGLWESKHSRLCFRGNNLSLSNFIQSFGFGQDQELPFDIFRTTLTVVVPLPDNVHDVEPEQRLIIEGIFEEKLEKLMQNLSPSIDIEVTSFEPADVPGRTAISFVSFDSEDNDYMPLLADEQLDYVKSLGRSDLTVKDQVIHWEGPDLCALVTPWTLCPQNAQCINTLGSYSCVCKPGYYDVSSLVKPSVIHPVCNENGLFSQCLEKFVSGGVARSYLESAMSGKMDIKLNDGQCKVEEGATFYYFNISRQGSDCGTEKRINKTHFEFKNRMSVRLRAEEVISRRDLKIIWVCVYPRHYVRNTQVSVAMERLQAFSVVQLNSSLQLAMALYTDVSFSNTYDRIIRLWSDDYLFIEVRLQTNKTFASDVLVQVESCWATEDSDPDNPVQGVLLQDSCPIDPTFQWHSDNGQTQKSKFSVRMFYMPDRKPFYIHCRANVCGPNENCVETCASQQRRKRSVDEAGGWRKLSAVVSAGPVVVDTREHPPSSWTEYLSMILTVAGSIGLLGLTILFVSSTKAVMNYYERLRLKASHQ